LKLSVAKFATVIFVEIRHRASSPKDAGATRSFTMYIDSFKVFCDLVKTSSFSRAAEKNKITQSAVSQQIRTLEIRFGVTLVERGRRNVSLTPEGSAFHDACLKIIGIWDDFEKELGHLKNEVSGEIKIAAVYSLGLYRLPAVIKSFGAEHPEVAVALDYGSHDSICEKLLEGRFDAAVVAFAPKHKDIIFEEFGTDELVIALAPGHPLSKKSKLDLSSLNGLGFVHFDATAPTRKVIDRSLRDAGAKVSVRGQFESVETIKRVVQVEGLAAIVPLDSIRAEVAAGTLVKVNIDGPKITRPIGIAITRTRSRPPGLKEFVAALKG
jgi:LysR family transcriptional regulator, transcriptional activator of the cysJI operon